MEPTKVKKSKRLRRKTTLERLIDEALWESVAMAYICIKLSEQNKKINSQIKKQLQVKMDELLQDEGNRFATFGMDLEAEVLPISRWLSLRDGFILGTAS